MEMTNPRRWAALYLGVMVLATVYVMTCAILSGMAYGAPDQPAALAAQNRLIAIAPSFPGAHSDRAATRWFLDDLDGAESDALEALRQNPQDEQAKSVLGALYYHRGDYAQALPFFEQTRDLPYLAYTYLHTGQTEKAVQTFTEAIEADGPSQDLLLGRADAYEALGRHDLAAADAKAAQEYSEE